MNKRELKEKINGYCKDGIKHGLTVDINGIEHVIKNEIKIEKDSRHLYGNYSLCTESVDNYIDKLKNQIELIEILNKELKKYED